MKLSKKDALIKVQELKSKLMGTSVEEDDGSDSGDYEQNKSYSHSINDLRKIRGEVSELDIDGIDCDALWERSFSSFPSGWFNSNAPGDLYTQTATYIDLLIDACIESGDSVD